MNTEHPNITLRKRIEALPEDSVLFRSDFPEYHSEFVGETLAELTQEGLLVKLAQVYMPNQDGVVLGWYYLL